MLRRTALAALFVLGLAAVPAHAGSQLDFTVVNKTGYGVSELYVAPSASTDWEENLLEETLENNESIKITFSKKQEHIAKWDIMITFVDDDSKVYWKGYKLSEIQKLTLKYDRKAGTTTAIAE